MNNYTNNTRGTSPESIIHVRLQGDASAVPFSPSVCSLAAWLEVSVLSPSVELR